MSQVDDIRVFLPVALADGKVQAHQNGINIIIESDFGLRLSYDTLAGVILQLPSTYHSAPKGLCGNYNGKLSDDPPSADTEVVIEKDEEPCEPSCGATSCPEPDESKVPDAKQACDIIQSKKGPFSGCHSTVAPTPDYEACVRQGSPSVKVLCLIRTVTGIQAAGSSNPTSTCSTL